MSTMVAYHFFKTDSCPLSADGLLRFHLPSLPSALACPGGGFGIGDWEETGACASELRQDGDCGLTGGAGGARRRYDEDEARAKTEAKRRRLFTDGSRPDSGAGYAVTWQNGQDCMGIKIHMGVNQEGNDAQCAALATENCGK